MTLYREKVEEQKHRCQRAQWPLRVSKSVLINWMSSRERRDQNVPLDFPADQHPTQLCSSSLRCLPDNKRPSKKK